MSSGVPRVLFVLEWMPVYRVEFFQSLSDQLGERGVHLSVVHGDPSPAMAPRSDASALTDARFRPNTFLHAGKRGLVWQPWRDEALQSDLIVVNEGSRLLLNYWLLGQQRRGRGRVAFWGHGANLDEQNAFWPAESLKRRLYLLPHWWFAYTEGSQRRIVDLGFPSERITIVRNAAPTEALRRRIDELRLEDVEGLRTELGLHKGPICVFLGSLYAGKRVPFLLAAADEIASARPDFSLIIAGEGPEREKLAGLVAQRPYARMAGRVNGDRKAMLLKAATLLLLPGAVGLSVLDGFAVATPTITTAIPTHGPEIEYLVNDVNGRILPASASPHQYAQAVLHLLRDPDDLARLARGAAISGRTYTGEAMVRRFTEGIATALATRRAPRVRWRHPLTTL